MAEPLVTAGYRPALRAHMANATPCPPKPPPSRAKRDGRWSLRRALAVWLAASFALWLTWAYAALWLHWLG